MPTVPTTDIDLVNFCTEHAEIWALDPAGLGLGALQVTQLTNLTQTAANSLEAARKARETSKATTVMMRADISAVRTYVNDLIRIIKGYAEVQANPAAVYSQAQIPPPAAPGPVPAPSQPTNLTATLNATSGEITLRWKATQPQGASGTTYIVRRRQSGTGEFAFVGVTGAKSFIDSSFFAGPDVVEYTVQAQRADASGPVSSILTVNFGRTGSTLTITGTSSQAA